jgi:hypothetical protein
MFSLHAQIAEGAGLISLCRRHTSGVARASPVPLKAVLLKPAKGTARLDRGRTKPKRNIPLHHHSLSAPGKQASCKLLNWTSQEAGQRRRCLASTKKRLIDQRGSKIGHQERQARSAKILRNFGQPPKFRSRHVLSNSAAQSLTVSSLHQCNEVHCECRRLC